MQTLNLDQFNQLLLSTPIKPRLKRDLRFVTSTSGMNESDWRVREFINITDRTGKRGILLIELEGQLSILPYELSIGLRSQYNGRLSPIICDFCRTWQAGSNAGSISFNKQPRSLDSVTYLCCADLACSLHVRTQTDAAIKSRAQLREDLTNDQRVERLRAKLQTIISELPLNFTVTR